VAITAALIAALVPILGDALKKIIPNTEERDRVAGEIAQKAAETASQAQLSQIEVSRVEAQHPSVFVSGFRPAAGWVCVGGLFYQHLAQPLLAWGATIVAIPAPPQLDVTDLMFLLGSLLGISIPRTVEKLKGVARVK
jgi:hypothetical protein